MLSSYLTSSYLQYKEDTNVVASWLATTAKKCGYATDLLINKDKDKDGKPDESKKQKQQGSGRLKGKARRLNRAAATTTTAAAAAAEKETPTYTIAVDDFINLADRIAGYKNVKTQTPLRVPQTVVGAIDRAISVRQSHGAIVKDKDEKSDQRHGYFIGVLEHVRDVLRPLIPVEARDTTDDENVPLNKFEGLEVQEPSDEFLQAPGVTPATTPEQQQQQPNYEAEQLQDMEEALLAFQLLVEDYRKFRNLIHGTWQGYRQGMFDLMAASLMTNTALDLARRMEEDAKPLFAKFGGSERMLQLVFFALCMDQGEDQNAKEKPGDEMNFRMYEASTPIFWSTYQILKSFLRLDIGPRSVPQYKPGFYGVYDPSSERSQKTAREKFREDRIILMEILPEFCYFCIGSEFAPAEDELIRGLRTAFKTKQVTLSLVFAVQVYLDTHEALRGDVGRGFSDLKNTGHMIDKSIKLTLESHASLRVENWPRENDREFKSIQARIDWWTRTDPLIATKQRAGRPTGEPFRLLKSHPLYCGLCALSLQAHYQDVSVTFVNAWGSILYTHHLYNAVRQEKLLETKWKDMDLVMGLQGDVFVGGDPPRDTKDYFKRFTLSMGYSATAFARNKRDTGRRPPQESKRGPRGLDELAPVAQMFKNRFWHCTGQVDLSLQDVEKIAARAHWEQDDEDISDDLNELSLNRPSKKNNVDTPANKKRPSTTGQTQVSAIALLKHIRNGLQGETMEISIDYLALHRICWLLLRTVKDHCDQDLRQIFGAGYLQEENQLPFMVGYIFMAATESKQLAGILMPRRSEEVTSRLLVQAASVLQEYIPKCGNLICSIIEQQHNIAVADSDDEDSESE